VSLLLALLFAQLRLQDERLIARVTDMSGDVQASSCHGHLLIAWRDGDGIAAAADGRTISISASTRGTPAIACGNDSWLVVWPSNDFGVDGRRVALDGSLLATSALFRGPFGASEVAAAHGDSGFLVAWTDGVTVRAARLNDAATVLDVPPLTVGLSGPFVSPRILWTGSAFFLAWAEDRINPLSPRPTRLWGTRVSAGGKVDAISLPMIEAGAGLRGLRPSLTTNGDRITIAWVAEHGSQTCVDVAQVNESRNVLVAPTQLRCSGDDGAPVLDEAEIRWSHRELVLVWRELRSDFSSVLFVARLDERAVLVDPIFTLLSRLGAASLGPGLTAGSAGVVAAYFSTLPAPEKTVIGVWQRVLAQDPIATRRRAAGH
jgi:hypothetical protein